MTSLEDLRLGERLRGCPNMARHPAWVRHGHQAMRAGFGVLLANCIEPAVVDEAGDTYQHRPHAAMHIGDPAVDQPAHQHIARVANDSRRLKDLASPGVRPPASLKRASGDRLRQYGDRTSTTLEHDAVLLDEGNRPMR